MMVERMAMRTREDWRSKRAIARRGRRANGLVSGAETVICARIEELRGSGLCGKQDREGTWARGSLS